MKGPRKNSRQSAGDASSSNSASDTSSGFNAKSLRAGSNYDTIGERKMRLSNRPAHGAVVGNSKVVSAVKRVQALNLRAGLNRVNRLDPSGAGDSSRKLMDDQSVATFGITDSTKYRMQNPIITPNTVKSPIINQSPRVDKSLRRNSSHASSTDPSLSSQPEGQPSVTSRKSFPGKPSLDVPSSSVTTEVTEGTTTEPIDMFDDFTRQRRSSMVTAGELDPFENKDPFASLNIENIHLHSSTIQEVNPDGYAKMDYDSEGSENYSALGQESSPALGKKTKMQKIAELLAAKKKWSLERRALRLELTEQTEQIAKLELKLKEAGEAETRAVASRTAIDHDEELNRIKQELERYQKEAKQIKKQLQIKKSELLSKNKELDANTTEISTLRKELSQALQQVDMLEEQQESDKTKILKLTKDLAHARQGNEEDDDSFDDGQTRQEQQEIFERELKKKDRQLESQRMEIQDQLEQMKRLKVELEQAQKLLQVNESMSEKMSELTEVNEEITSELERKKKELVDVKQSHAAILDEKASVLKESERKRGILVVNLEEAKANLEIESKKVKELSLQNNQSLATVQKELEDSRSALKTAESRIQIMANEHEQTISNMQENIQQLEAQNRELNTRLDELGPINEKALNELRTSNEALEKSIKELKKKVADDQNEFTKMENKLNSQISSLRSSLDASQSLHQQSEGEAKKGVSTLQSKLSEMELAMEEMKQYNEELEASAEELRETSADFEQEISKLQKVNTESLEKCSRLEQELNDTRQKVLELDKIQALLVEAHEQVYLLNEKNQALEYNVSKLSDENEDLKENMEEIESDAAEARQAVSALEDLMEEYEEIQDEAQSLREKVSLLEADLEKVRMECQDWMKSTETLTGELEEARGLLIRTEETGKELSQKLDIETEELRRTRDQFRAQLDEANADSARLQNELEAARVEITNLENELGDVKARLHTKEKEADNIQVENGILRSKLEKVSTDRDTWMVNANEARVEAATKKELLTEIQSLKDENSSLHTQIDEITSIVDGDQSRIQELLMERDEWKITAQNAETQLEKTQSALDALEDLMEDFEALQVEVDTLRDEKTSLESQVEKLQLAKSDAEEKYRLASLTAEAEFSQCEKLKQELQKFQRNLIEMEDKNGLLTNKVTEYQSSIEELKKKLSKSEASAMNAEESSKKLIEYQECIEKLEKTLVEIQDQNEDYGRKLKALNSECLDWKNNHHATNTELNEAKKSILSLENDIQNKSSEISKLKSDLAKIEIEGGKLRDSLMSKDAEIHTSQKRYDDLLRDMESKSTEVVKSQECMKTASSELVAAKGKNESLNEKIRSLQVELDKLQSGYTDLTDATNSLTEDRDNLVEKNMDLQLLLAEKETVLASFDEVQRNRSALLIELDDLSKRCAQSDATIEKLNDEVKHWQQVAETSEHQAGEANDALISLEERMEQIFRGERDQMAFDLKQAQNLLDEVTKERNSLQVSLLDAEKNFATLKEERNSLRAVSEDLESRLKACNTEIERLTLITEKLRGAEKQVDELRMEKSQSLSRISLMKADNDNMKAALSNVKEIETELNEKRILLQDSRGKIVELEKQCANFESQLQSMMEESKSLQSQLELARSDKSNVSSTEKVKDAHGFNESNSLFENLKQVIAELREQLKISDSEDAVNAVKLIQEDHAYLLDENDRMREMLADFEVEIEDLHAEREELLYQAERNMEENGKRVSNQEECSELQKKLEEITRERDKLKEALELSAKEQAKSENKIRLLSDNDDTSSIRTDNSDSKNVLQQAQEYRERRESKKSSWSFSTFGTQRQGKSECDASDDASTREMLIDRLTEANEVCQEKNLELQTEISELKATMKEEALTMKRRLDVMYQENQAYELKVMVLEQEFERLSLEAKKRSARIEDKDRAESLQREVQDIEMKKQSAEREIAKLRLELDKFQRGSTLDAHHKQVEIDHLKNIQEDIQAKVDALENMMNAINQENETLRHIAQKAAGFSLNSSLGRQLESDEKDVKIAELQCQLVDLRLQGHQKLRDQVLQLQSEKREMQVAMEEHFQVLEQENRGHLEGLEMSLRTKEQTIKQLERILETVSAHAEDINSVGELSYDASGDDSTYFSDKR